jgi:CheY-like chemotaxis protein
MAVLIVDDNALNRRMLALFADRLGLEVVEAADGASALERLRARPDVEVIVTDLAMPNMDGFGFVERLRAEISWRRIPVILCTASADRTAVRRAAEFGLAAVIVKPVDRDRFEREVTAALRSIPPRLLPRTDVVRRSGLSSEQYVELLQQFCEQARFLVVQQEWSAADLRQLVESCVLVGAERATTLTRELLGAMRAANAAPANPLLCHELEQLDAMMQARISSAAKRAAASVGLSVDAAAALTGAAAAPAAETPPAPAPPDPAD